MQEHIPTPIEPWWWKYLYELLVMLIISPIAGYFGQKIVRKKRGKNR